MASYRDSGGLLAIIVEDHAKAPRTLWLTGARCGLTSAGMREVAHSCG
jgi:hypothetical protein